MENQNFNQQPQQPQQQNNMHGAPDNKGLAIAALVCGILGIIGSYIPIVQYFTFVLAILGIVFGAKARKIQANGMATAGLVLGIIGTCIGALGVVCVICAGGLLAGLGALA